MTLSVPEQIVGLPLIVSVSGGKDSTALMLALRESGLPFRAVFADTLWEAPETYEYIEMLRERIAPIDVVGVNGGMTEKIRKRAGFPARLQRWCTRELKVGPLRAYHDAIGDDTVSVVGIRRDESAARSEWSELLDDSEWGGWVWAPLVSWTVADVIAIHHRHDIPMNPLYTRGHDRVGCYPCINATKGEIALIAEYAPARIDEIRMLESDVVTIRDDRNRETPGRYAHMVGSFFQGRDTRSGFAPIDRVVEWSRTTRGGKQLPLLVDPPSGGCFRWGLCEPPPKERG